MDPGSSIMRFTAAIVAHGADVGCRLHINVPAEPSRFNTNSNVLHQAIVSQILEFFFEYLESPFQPQWRRFFHNTIYSVKMSSKDGNQEYGTRPDPSFTAENNRLVFRFDAELLIIEPWGLDALRVRATCLACLPEKPWALTETLPSLSPTINIKDSSASITNGKIKADVSRRGKIIITNTNTGKVLLEEYARHRLDVVDPKCSSLRIQPREWKPRLGSSDYHLTMRFESQDAGERIYGMGQYQQPFLNLKGADLELAQRNSQATVPFALSSLGYGFLWNNPGIGRAVFSTLTTTFEAYSTDILDYWIVAGDSPADIVRAYTKATGRVP